MPTRYGRMRSAKFLSVGFCHCFLLLSGHRGMRALMRQTLAFLSSFLFLLISGIDGMGKNSHFVW